jgi:hypothetical protein
MRFSFVALLCVFVTLAFGGEAPAPAETDVQPQPHKNRWLIQTSVWTDHFDTDSAHVKHQNLIGVEWWAANNWIMGAAAFKNSFGQPSQTVYIGKLWRPLDSFPLAHVKLVGGILHGYKGEYKDKIPLNSDQGFAPLLLPSIGLSGNRFTTDLVIFGTAGVLLTIGVLVP